MKREWDIAKIIKVAKNINRITIIIAIVIHIMVGIAMWMERSKIFIPSNLEWILLILIIIGLLYAIFISNKMKQVGMSGGVLMCVGIILLLTYNINYVMVAFSAVATACSIDKINDFEKKLSIKNQNGG